MRQTASCPALYTPGSGGTTVRLDALGDAARRAPAMLGGGGGLVSTGSDYDRFTQMLLHRADSPAGELDGTRLLSPRTVGYMTRNHLPGGADLETLGRPLYAESPFRGVGFGLGLAVVLDPVPGKALLPSSAYLIRPQLRKLVYQALTG